jgi:hypothetical protein
MMKSRVILILLILIVLCLGGPIIVGTAIVKGLNEEATATWVQAVFAIVAILAGFWVALEQLDAARQDEIKRAKARDDEAGRAASYLARNAVGVLEDVIHRLAEPDPLFGEEIQRLKRQAGYQYEVLARFPVESLKSFGAITGFAPLAGYLGSLCDNLTELADTTMRRDAGPALHAPPDLVKIVLTRLEGLRNGAQDDLCRLGVTAL